MSKFAAMTSSLLARKGDAVPSTVTPLTWDDGPKLVPVCKNDAPPSPAKSRRLVLSFSAREFENLGLLAVKRGVSRHALAQEAMALYFENLAGEYGCACIGNCREPCAAE